ncbi:MAG: cation transporter [Cyanobacteria bacterium SZAS LIN-2]|nr:cation transporter [Cyanobacteria bacterium SZAS LIN-2]
MSDHNHDHDDHNRHDPPGGKKHVHKAPAHAHEHRPHHDFRNQNRSRLWTVLLMTLAFMAVEVVTGLYTGSLALLADAGHMLSDGAGLAMALIAVWFAAKPANQAKSYGYYRTEILVSLANAVMLIGISIFVLYNAFGRLMAPPVVLSGPMVWVSILGLLTNLVAVKILHSSADHSLNMRGAYLEVLNDMIGSAGVLVAALIITFTGWYWVDAVVSGLIGLLIIPRTWMLLKECINILMEGTPGRIDLRALKAELKAVPGVVGVHDLHVWTITSGMDSLSAHVQIDDSVAPTVVLESVHNMLREKFEIHHSTVQTELVDCKQGCQCD